MFRNRLKNYGLWVSVAALVPLALSAFGVRFIDNQKYTELINSLLAVLVGLGIVNDPTTTNKWFNDDKNDPEQIIGKDDHE